jgi:hypothetical protein
VGNDVKERLKKIRREAGNQGWRVERGKNYYKMWCPNPCRCFKTMHLSPSDPNYPRNLLGQLGRATCWKEPE